MTADAPAERVIVDEEVPDAPGLAAEDSERSDLAPTDDKSTTAKTDPDLLSEDGAEDLEEDLATGTEPVKPAPAAAPETKQAKAEPFKYQGDKKDLVLEGAHYYAGDGLYIPEAQVPRLKQLLATAAVHNGSWQRRERELARSIEEARTGRTEKDVAADALMDLVFKDLATLKTDDDVYEWAVNFRQNLPQHRLAIKERQLEHRQKEFERRQEPDPEEREEELSNLASEELDRTLDEIWKMPELKVLDADDQRELKARFGPRARQLISVADRADPQSGLMKGDLIFDGAALLEQVKVAAGIKARAVRSNTAANAAAEHNRRKVGAAPVARVPAAARTSGTGSEAPRDERTGRFKTREEYEDWIRSDKE